MILNSDSKVLNLTEDTVTSRRLAWAAVGAAWGAILFAYRDQVALIVEAWETLPSHAHGYVVMLVVAYLAWGKRELLRGAPFAPSKAGFAAALVAGLAGFAGELVSAGVVVQFALVFMLQAAVWAILGWRAFRILAGPLCFLLFAIPFGHDILPTLMDWTANATVVGLRASGVPVLQQDRYFVIPSGSWSVVEACSGIRYLLTSFFVGSIFAYITYTRWQKRVLFIVWMIILPLLANWLRAYVIVMAAHLSNNQWGLGLSHLAFGWVIFAVSVIGSFYVGSTWRDEEPLRKAGPLARASSGKVSLGAAIVMIAIAAGWTQAAQGVMNPSPRPAPVLDLTKTLESLEAVRATLPMVESQFVGASAVHRGTYRFEEGEIGLTVAYYRDQHQGAELINVNNVIEPSHVWGWRSSGRIPSPAEGIPDLRAEYYAKADAVAAVGTLYWVGGLTTTSDVISKVFQALNLVTGRGDDGASIVITASGVPGDETYRRRIEDFVRERLPTLLADLDAIHAGRENPPPLMQAGRP